MAIPAGSIPGLVRIQLYFRVVPGTGPQICPVVDPSRVTERSMGKGVRADSKGAVSNHMKADFHPMSVCTTNEKKNQRRTPQLPKYSVRGLTL